MPQSTVLGDSDSCLQLLSDVCDLPKPTPATAMIPKLRKRSTTSAEEDSDRGGTLMWVPDTLKESTVREFENYCKSVVRKNLKCNSSKNDKKDRDARYLHDKALSILHHSKYDVGRAKAIIRENPNLISRGELCTYDIASKVKMGVIDFGRDFSTIKRERLFDQNTSVGDLINLYYLTKKRSPQLLFPPSLETKLPVIMDEEEEEEIQQDRDVINEPEPSHALSILDDEYNLEMEDIPMSPLTIPSPSSHNNSLYYSDFPFTTEPLDSTAADAGFNDSASEDEGSLSCEDFFVAIDCSSSCEGSYDSDENSNVDFNTYHEDEVFNGIKVDDLFSLSNTL